MKKIHEKLNQTYSYSSLQIDMPKQFSNEVINWAISYIDENYLYEEKDDNSYGLEDEIHCTVLYGIYEIFPRQTRIILDPIQSFYINTKNITMFKTSSKYDVIKLDIESNELNELHYLLRNRVRNYNTFPIYKPHMTIGYVKKNSHDFLNNSTDFRDRKFLVKRLQFSSKNGNKYPIQLRNF